MIEPDEHRSCSADAVDHRPAIGHQIARGASDPDAHSLADVADVDVVGCHHYQDSFAAILTGADRPLGGVIWRAAELVCEPQNPHDDKAVAVHIEGKKVGHISRSLNASVFASICSAGCGELPAATVQCRVWALLKDGFWYARVTLDPTEPPGPEFTYVEEANWPGPSSPDAREQRTPEALDRWIEEVNRIGSYRGMFYNEYKDTIYATMAAGDLDAALTLLAGCNDAAFAYASASGTGVDRWPTERSAIVYRKLKRYRDEVAVLERLLRVVTPIDRTKGLQQRLARACELANQPQSPLCTDPQPPPAPDPEWIALENARPSFELAVSEDVTVWCQPRFFPVVEHILTAHSVDPGNQLLTHAVLREDRTGGNWFVAAFVDGWRVGHVSWPHSPQLREALREPNARGTDCVVKCTMTVANGRRTVMLRRGE